MRAARIESSRIIVALFAVSCSGSDAPATGVSALPPAAIARAGAELVSSSSVLRTAAAQGVTPRNALQACISDAIFAHAARLELSPATMRNLERVAAARALLELIQSEAERAGPPTPAELGKIAQERWTDLNRPDAVRTTHAVVMNDKPARDAAARAVAEKLAAALAHVKSESELIGVASAFPSEGFEIHAEALPFVTADGRIFERRDGAFVAGQGAFDLDFARGASALTEPGQLSGVVKSAFGYHVIRLEERAPGVVVSDAELAALAGDEVLQRRAKRARRELVERLRGATTTRVERAVEELTAQVKVAP